MQRTLKAAIMLALLGIIPCWMVSGADFWFEAESASNQSTFTPFRVVSDATAYGGNYVVYDDANIPPIITNPPPTNGIMSFKFYASGSVYIWVRVKTASSSSDSIWMKVNNDAFAIWNIGTNTSWTWKKWNATAKAITGASTLSIARGDRSAQIDKIYITTTSTTPSSDGNFPSTTIKTLDGWRGSNLVLTNDDIETHGNQNSDLVSAFDNSTGTNIQFNNKTTAYVQIELPDSYAISRVRANLNSNENFKVEAADTVSDLDGQTGTYKLIVANDITLSTTGWLECQIDALAKKIWRYKAQNVSASATTVTINELEIANNDTASPAAPPAPTISADDARTVIITWPAAGGTPTPTPAPGVTPVLDTWVPSYNIYRNNALIGQTSTNYYSDKFLSPSTAYTYNIAACDEVGLPSATTSPISVTTGNTMKFKSTQNVLVIIYDPIIKAGSYPYIDGNGQQQSYLVASDTPYSQLTGINQYGFETGGWNAFKDNITRTTGGSLQLSLTPANTITVNDYFPYNDPYDFNTLSSSNIIQSGMTGKNTGGVDFEWGHGGLNYGKVIKDQNILNKIESGAIDGIVFKTTYNIPNAWDEAFMFSSQSDNFPLNAICRWITTSRRVWVLESGYHSEECIGHCFETVFKNAYANWPKAKWTYNVLNSFDINDTGRTTASKTIGDWQKFNQTECMGESDANFKPVGFLDGTGNFQAPGFGQVGAMHYPEAPTAHSGRPKSPNCCASCSVPSRPAPTTPRPVKCFGAATSKPIAPVFDAGPWSITWPRTSLTSTYPNPLNAGRCSTGEPSGNTMPPRITG
jgi:hypothetical protein